MALTLPSVNIYFSQLASSFVERSSRGNAILIIKDDTNKSFNTKEYALSTDADQDKSLYDATNFQYIKDAMVGLPNKVTVVRVDAEATLSDALKIVSGLETGWITLADGTASEYNDLAIWIKQMEAQKKTFKAAVFKPTNPPDCQHVVSLCNEKVTFSDSRGEETGEKFLPSLVGFLAGANILHGTTFLAMSNLKIAQEPDNVDKELNSGKLVLINDEGTVKIGLGINTLTTLDDMHTADMQKITITETQDMMLDDIRRTFRENHVGKYRNNIDKQYVFINAINNYFKSLTKVENGEVLDETYDNKSFIDVEAQRQAWIAAGKEAAASWTEAQVKNNAYKNFLFLDADVKMVDMMENLTFKISMF